jgi:hypothetical protein
VVFHRLDEKPIISIESKQFVAVFQAVASTQPSSLHDLLLPLLLDQHETVLLNGREEDSSLTYADELLQRIHSTINQMIESNNKEEQRVGKSFEWTSLETKLTPYLRENLQQTTPAFDQLLGDHRKLLSFLGVLKALHERRRKGFETAAVLVFASHLFLLNPQQVEQELRSLDFFHLLEKIEYNDPRSDCQ